jgi:hypothetical protein
VGGAGSCEMFIIVYHDFVSWTTVIFITTAVETSNRIFQKMTLVIYIREWTKSKVIESEVLTALVMKSFYEI